MKHTYKFILFFTITIMSLNLSHAQTAELNGKQKSAVIVLNEDRTAYVDTYFLNGKLMLPLEAIWDRLLPYDDAPAYSKGSNFITLKKHDDAYYLEDNFPIVKVSLNRPEFYCKAVPYRFDALQIVDEKIYVSADFFLKAYNWQVSFGVGRWNMLMHVKLREICDIEGATVLMKKGATLEIKLDNTPNHEWKFDIDNPAGIFRDHNAPSTIDLDRRHSWGTRLNPETGEEEYFEEDTIYESDHTYGFTAKKAGKYTITADNGIDRYVYTITVY